MDYIVRAPIIHDGAVYAPGARIVLDEEQARLIPWAVVTAAHSEPSDAGASSETATADGESTDPDEGGEESTADEGDGDKTLPTAGRKGKKK